MRPSPRVDRDGSLPLPTLQDLGPRRGPPAWGWCALEQNDTIRRVSGQARHVAALARVGITRRREEGGVAVTVSETFQGQVWRRGEEGYEDARRAAVWQARKFERYPDVIARPANDADVVDAVRYARREGLKVKARGGGHSHTGSALRDG